MSKALIEFIFVNFNNQPTNLNVVKYQLSFQKEPNNIGNSENVIIAIPEHIFKYNKYKSIISIKLFNQKSLINCTNMTVYNSKNSAYIFVGTKGKSFEIIFRKMKELKIEMYDKILDKLDSMETIDRKRLVLINYEFASIKINKYIYELYKNIFWNCEITSSSYQISIFSLEKNLSIIKPILDNDPSLIMNELNKMKNLICQKSKEFENSLDLNDMKDYELFIKYIKNNNNGISSDNFEKFFLINTPKRYLEEIFENNNLVNLDLYFK